ncbi:peptidoglycan editing factor PgeF [Halanaerocella petrolearia]
MIKIFKLKIEDGVKYYIIEEFSETGLVEHAFSTKIGGVSKDEYTSLNLGLHVSDNKEDVVENRRRICNLLDSDHQQLVAGKQLHNDRVKIINREDKGSGALSYDTALENTDALLTDKKGILLTSYYADCTPILLLDPVLEVVGLVHAGWKGTVKKIAQQTVLQMKEVYGTNLSDLLVGVGPSIGKCCYQVDEQVINPLQKEFSNWEEFVEEVDDQQWKLDLSLANQVQLEEVGVERRNIIHSNLCTACHSNLFYSYRRDKGETGRMASLIKLK